MTRTIAFMMATAILLLTMVAIFEGMLNLQMMDMLRGLNAEIEALSQRVYPEPPPEPPRHDRPQGATNERPKL